MGNKARKNFGKGKRRSKKSKAGLKNVQQKLANKTTTSETSIRESQVTSDVASTAVVEERPNSPILVPVPATPPSGSHQRHAPHDRRDGQRHLSESDISKSNDTFSPNTSAMYNDIAK